MENNHLQVARLLLELKASPNEPINSGKTCLHAAAENGHYDMCSLLINNGAYINALLPGNHLSPLHLAIYRNHTEVCELLLEKGATIFFNPISEPRHSTSSSTFSHLGPFNISLPLRQGHSRSLSNGSTISESSSSGGLPTPPSPMIIACSYGCTDIVSLLLEHGATVFEKDPASGQSCLMACSENGYDETAYFLLTQTNLTQSEQERMVNETCDLSQGWSSLHFASAKGHAAVVQILVQYGAHLDTTDMVGRTPLHYVSIVRNTTFSNQMVPKASLRGYPECVRLLIEYGADTTIRDFEGKLPIDLATETLQYYNIQTQFKRSMRKRQEIQAQMRSIPSITISRYAVDANITSSPQLTAPYNNFR